MEDFIRTSPPLLGQAPCGLPHRAYTIAVLGESHGKTLAQQAIPKACRTTSTPGQFRSLNQLLEESFKKNAAKPFSVCMDRWMSYGELDELSAALGAWLQSLGLEPGARVAIMLPNIPQFAVTMAGDPARRLHLRECESAVHPARAGASAQGLGCHDDRHSGKLRRYACRGDRAVAGQAYRHGIDGRFAWLSGMAAGSLLPCVIWPKWFQRTSCR